MSCCDGGIPPTFASHSWSVSFQPLYHILRYLFISGDPPSLFSPTCCPLRATLVFDRKMDPLEYLATLLSKVELLSRMIEVEEEQVADWAGRATALEESIVMGMNLSERRSIEKKIRVCWKEAERLEEAVRREKKELEELEEARIGLERAGFRM